MNCDDELVAKGTLWVGSVLPALKYQLSQYLDPISAQFNKLIYTEISKENWIIDNFFFLNQIRILDDRGLDSFVKLIDKYFKKDKTVAEKVFWYEAIDY